MSSTSDLINSSHKFNNDDIFEVVVEEARKVSFTIEEVSFRGFQFDRGVRLSDGLRLNTTPSRIRTK